MPSPRPLMSPQAEADLHDIAVTLKMMLVMQMAAKGSTGMFDAYLRSMFHDGAYEQVKAMIDAGPGPVRAVA